MLSLGLSLTSTAVVHGVAYDFFVDVSTGNDANDGSQITPFASLTPIVTIMNALPDNGRLRTLVKTGLYVNTSGINDFMLATNVNSGAHVIIYCEQNVVFQGVSGVNTNFVDVEGLFPWTLEIVGLGPVGGANRARITGFDTGGGDGLGLTTNAGAWLIARNLTIDGCIDGVSLHGSNANALVEDCTFENNSKSAFSHVHTGGSFTARRCTFSAPAGAINGIGVETTAASANSLYEDCQFIPATAGQQLDFMQSTVRRCRIGTLALRAGFPGSLFGNANGPTTVEDCFIHAFWRAYSPVIMSRCFGKMTMGNGNDAPPSIIDHCVFVDGANGSNTALWGVFDWGSQAKITIKNSIIARMVVGLGHQWTPTYSGYFSASDSRAVYNCVNGSVYVIHPDLEALGAPYIANNITTDPLLGPANSYDVNDYKVLVGSPTLGAGDGGVDIGLGLAT